MTDPPVFQNNDSSNNGSISPVGNNTPLSCNLTSEELRARKATVLACLKKQVTEKKELINGFAYKFRGSDNTLDELASFVKSERRCCSFFTFTLSITAEEDTWLLITGPEGVKDFIRTEFGW